MTVDFPMKEKEQVWVGDLSTADKELLIKNLLAKYGEIVNENDIPVREITSINYSPKNKHLYVHDDFLESFHFFAQNGFPALAILKTPTRNIDLDGIL